MGGKSLRNYGKEWKYICKRFVCLNGDMSPTGKDFDVISDEIDRIIECDNGIQESILKMLVKDSSETAG
ncbi:hypothetical protein ABG067_009417, partial [Albugo candida]